MWKSSFLKALKIGKQQQKAAQTKVFRPKDATFVRCSDHFLTGENNVLVIHYIVLSE